MISARKFGIEFEHISNKDCTALALELARAQIGVDPDAIRRTNPAYAGWQVKPDSSITTCTKYPHQIELVTPPITFAQMKEVATALKVARTFGGVNSSCGLHVHVSAPEIANRVNGGRDTEYMNYVAKTWKAVEDVFFTYVPPSRRNGHTCRPGVEWGTKYKALNLSPLGSSKHTIEFRCHNSTLDPFKALSFARLCVAFVDALVAEMAITKLNPKYNAKHVKQQQFKTHAGNIITLMRDEGLWTIKSRKTKIEAPTLSEAWKFKEELSIKAPDYLVGFHYPVQGNAMSQLTQALGVTGAFRGYLEDRYERMLLAHGPMGSHETNVVMRDEADFFNEPDLDEQSSTVRPQPYPYDTELTQTDGEEELR